MVMDQVDAARIDISEHAMGCACGVCAEREGGGAATGAGTGSTGINAPVGTLDDLADYLTSGYWGRAARSFDTSQSNQITVNITALTLEGQQLARWAFEAWEAVVDLEFVEITTDADIDFDDDQSGAYAGFSSSSSTIMSAYVNVHTSWTNSDWENSVDSHGFLTYMHEVGHALGLGHQGDYNGSADYATQAVYANDSYAVSIMSYFDQGENPWETADWGRPVTLMGADIVAGQALYGAAGAGSSTDGATTWGYNSTMGGYLEAYFDAMTGAVPNTEYARGVATAFTIHDVGGVDHLDLSGETLASRVDLNAEATSDFAGRTGVVSIARGTVIENVTTGSGGDDVLGNAAANLISTGAGDDLIRAGSGDDTVAGGTGADSLEGGSGADALDGGDGDDLLDGGAGRDLLTGGAGNDTLTGGMEEGQAGAPQTHEEIMTAYLSSGGARVALFSMGGSSQITSTTAWDRFDAGDGADEITAGSGSSYALAGDGDDLVTGGIGADTLYGGAGADTLLGGGSQDVLYGGDGADSLQGDAGSDSLWGGAGDDDLAGGAGNDWLRGGHGDDRIVAGDGDDVMQGGAGNDTLVAGMGSETLMGGEGADHFDFGTSLGTKLITDFDVTTDRLVLAGDGQGGAADYDVSTDAGTGALMLTFTTMDLTLLLAGVRSEAHILDTIEIL